MSVGSVESVAVLEGMLGIAIETNGVIKTIGAARQCVSRRVEIECRLGGSVERHRRENKHPYMPMESADSSRIQGLAHRGRYWVAREMLRKDVRVYLWPTFLGRVVDSTKSERTKYLHRRLGSRPEN